MPQSFAEHYVTIPIQMSEEKKRPKAVLLLSARFLREIQFSVAFPQINKQSCEQLWVSAYDYNLEDGYFAELKLYPRALKGELLHVFIPKHAILAILGNEDIDKAALGFTIED